MRASTFLANTAISVLIVASAGLILSVQLTNPLLKSQETLLPTLATVGLLAVAVLLTVTVGATTDHTETPYW